MRIADLGANLACQLEQVIGSDVTVALTGCTAKLRGRIPSEAARQAVLDISSEIAPWLNIVDELEVTPRPIDTVAPLHVVMPSYRHSVLAKAARYRSEPERVNIVAAEPLVAVVDGLHAEHAVRQTRHGLVCSCDRFRRGDGQCAHVLAVEYHRSAAAANSAAGS